MNEEKEVFGSFESYLLGYFATVVVFFGIATGIATVFWLISLLFENIAV